MVMINFRGITFDLDELVSFKAGTSRRKLSSEVYKVVFITFKNGKGITVRDDNKECLRILNRYFNQHHFHPGDGSEEAGWQKGAV